MPVEKRIRMCILIERIYKNEEYSKLLGLEDKTIFHGERLHGEEGEEVC